MQKKLSARIIRMFAVVAACALCLCFFACGNKTEPSGPATGDPPDSDYDDPYVVALRVVTEPQKKEYIAGESFDPSGMTLAADWSHGITEDLFATECEISPSEPLTEDVTELVFKYEGRTCTQEIKVTANDIIAFTVNRDAIGEVEPTGLLDLSQIKVSAEYLDGSKTDVVDYEICEKATQGVIAEPNSYMLTEGEHVFVVKYRNESAEFSVVGKDLSHGWPSEASESYVGGKENTITIYKNTAGAIKTNSEQGEVTGALTADQTITGLNSAAVGGAPFVEYTFTTADNVWVDIDWAISSASGAISDLGANITLTVDGVGIDIGDLALPAAADGWTIRHAVSEVYLMKGLHTVRAEADDDMGINIAGMQIHSDGDVYVGARLLRSDAFETERVNTLTIYRNGDGVQTNAPGGQDAPGFGLTAEQTISQLETGKTTDSGVPYVKYVFDTSEHGYIDIDWLISGSRWARGGVNNGNTDVGSTVILTLDGSPINLSGISLVPPANDNKNFWCLEHLTVNDLWLTAGKHELYAVAAENSMNINIGSLTIASDSEITACKIPAEQETNVYKAEINDGFESTLSQKITLYRNSVGVETNSNRGSAVGELTAEQTFGGLKKSQTSDKSAPFIKFTFTLAEAGTVDFAWSIAGADVIGGVNVGNSDLGEVLQFSLIGSTAKIDADGLSVVPGDGKNEWELHTFVVGGVKLDAGTYTFEVKCVVGNSMRLNAAEMTICSDAAITAGVTGE